MKEFSIVNIIESNKEKIHEAILNHYNNGSGNIFGENNVRIFTDWEGDKIKVSIYKMEALELLAVLYEDTSEWK